MRKQYQDLQREYASELGQIEEAFMRERDELLSGNKSEIDALFDRRRQMEIQFMEMKQEREEGYAEEIAALRVKDAEDYSKLKIKLETDTQTLEQQLEEMRATYQLNTEKLEYNYRVLTERDLENSTTLAQQKRKLARLKDALANYIQKYNTQDTKHKQVNQELTDEYRRITKQYKDLQVRCDDVLSCILCVCVSVRACACTRRPPFSPPPDSDPDTHTRVSMLCTPPFLTPLSSPSFYFSVFLSLPLLFLSLPTHIPATH